MKPTTPMLLLSTNTSSLESGECLSDELCTQELEKRLEEVREGKVEMIHKTLEELEALELERAK